MLTVNADALAVAQPRGLLPCLGRYVEHRALPACLRRIQIAERNETEHGQTGEGRLLTRRAVE